MERRMQERQEERKRRKEGKLGNKKTWDAKESAKYREKIGKNDEETKETQIIITQQDE